MREVRSSSCVEIGVLDVWELSEIELFDGESTPGLRKICRAAVAGGAGGSRFFPLPNTRPPPRLLRFAIMRLRLASRVRQASRPCRLSSPLMCR